MKLFETLLLTLKAGLELWATKEARKYLDEVMSLETRYYEEKKKPRPNMAVLDDIEHRLFVLSRTFASSAPRGPQASPPA